MRAAVFITMLLAGSASAATPCDFKGLAVGDHASPQAIMAALGVTKYEDQVAAKAAETKAEHDKAFAARMKRADEVGIMNATEESEFHDGPACDDSSCRIPYGTVTVGEQPFLITVEVFVAFDQTQKITAIDVKYSGSDWDEVLEMMNKKYGPGWQKEVIDDVTTNFATKKSYADPTTLLKHVPDGQNLKTGDSCTITAKSRDLVFEHSMPPLLRSVLEIKLVSTNF